jgi:hypothetical protein
MSAATPVELATTPAELGLERVFYESFLAGFREPVHSDVLRLMGDFIYTFAVETFYWLGEESLGLPGARRYAAAAADDLENAAEVLRGIRDEPVEARGSEEESAFRRAAGRWAARIEDLVIEMRGEIGGRDGSEDGGSGWEKPGRRPGPPQLPGTSGSSGSGGRGASGPVAWASLGLQRGGPSSSHTALRTLRPKGWPATRISPSSTQLAQRTGLLPSIFGIETRWPGSM